MHIRIAFLGLYPKDTIQIMGKKLTTQKILDCFQWQNIEATYMSQNKGMVK